MSIRLVFVFEGRTIVYQGEPPVAHVFGTKEKLPMTPELQAAIDAARASEARKAAE